MGVDLKFFPNTTRLSPTGEIVIGGVPVTQMAHQWGTPLYLYDAATVNGQLNRLKELLAALYQGEWEITYASKAYLSYPFARRLQGLGIGLDVVSLQELNLARCAEFEPMQVHLHGNNKSEAEILEALNWGVNTIVADSLEELGFIESLAARMNREASLWLRITPGIDVDTHPHVQTAHSASKFGVTIEDGQALQAIQKCTSSRWLKLKGLHTHLGSQIFDPIPFQRAVTMLFELADTAGYIPEEISTGGGWGVPYYDGHPEGDPQPWIEGVCSAMKRESGRRGWKQPKLILEPGRFIIARAGVAIYTVGTTKFTPGGKQIIAVDGGMADNPRPALYQSKYTVWLADRPGAERTHLSAVVGKYCESGDQLISEIKMPVTHRGDILAIPVAGAYQLSMSSNYNLAERPAVLWLENGKVNLMQQREEIPRNSWWLG